MVCGRSDPILMDLFHYIIRWNANFSFGHDLFVEFTLNLQPCRINSSPSNDVLADRSVLSAAYSLSLLKHVLLEKAKQTNSTGHNKIDSRIYSIKYTTLHHS